jgi:hypothetical protein
LAFLETAAIGAVFVLIFLGGDEREWSYVPAGLLIALGITQVLLVREARRRNSSYRPEAIYALLPLDRRQRNLVRLNLFGAVLYIPLLAVLAVAILDVDVLPTVLVLLIAGASGLRPLFRAWRHNSWLAISGLPERPPSKHSSP